MVSNKTTSKIITFTNLNLNVLIEGKSILGHEFLPAGSLREKGIIFLNYWLIAFGSVSCFMYLFLSHSVFYLSSVLPKELQSQFCVFMAFFILEALSITKMLILFMFIVAFAFCYVETTNYWLKYCIR